MPWRPLLRAPAPLPPPPPSDDLHTSKDDAYAAQAQYKEFVRRAITRDFEKKKIFKSRHPRGTVAILRIR